MQHSKGLQVLDSFPSDLRCSNTQPWSTTWLHSDEACDLQRFVIQSTKHRAITLRAASKVRTLPSDSLQEQECIRRSHHLSRRMRIAHEEAPTKTQLNLPCWPRDGHEVVCPLCALENENVFLFSRSGWRECEVRDGYDYTQTYLRPLLLRKNPGLLTSYRRANMCLANKHARKKPRGCLT